MNRPQQWQWIHSPFVDVGLIGYSWVPLFLVWLIVATATHEFSCEVTSSWTCPAPIQYLVAFALFVTRVHRHQTLGLVYGDKQVFAANRTMYVWAPLVVFGAVFLTGFWWLIPVQAPRTVFFAASVIIVSIMGTWNVYHSIMQKYGFLRIYASKLGYGNPALDKKMFFSWLAVVIVASVYLYNPDITLYLRASGYDFVKSLIPRLTAISLALLVPVGIYSLWVTGQWIRLENAHYAPANIPKLLFAASLFLMMAVFAHSLFLGYLVLGFSHAFEYFVFANIYVRRKYRGQSGKIWNPARWAAAPVLWNVVLAAIIFALYQLLAFKPTWGLIALYGTANSLLHFICDGLLWKMSRREVRDVVLNLNVLHLSDK